jgi:aspartyl-tRNA(Asn)/glutamyl-tRNA(Gln) amidotransferase subunit A
MAGVSELALLPIGDLAPRIARGEVSPVEVTRAALAAIAALEPRLNAFIRVEPETALAAARVAEADVRAGRYRGPLHGIPVGIKDNLAVAGWPTTNASQAMADHVTTYDATAVARLRTAGAIVVGKNNMHEWAKGGTCAGGYFGAVHNPWALDCIPGGSSGGSAAAVSAGEVFASLGTDGMGSVRHPAAMCGVVGVKPTQGLVSRWGELPPTSASTDHVGPICRTVVDAALVLTAIAGHDPRDPTSARSEPKDYGAQLAGSIRGLRVGVPENYFFDDLDPEVERAVRAAVETLVGLGAEVRPVTIPLIEYAYPASALIPNESLAFHRPLVAGRPDAYWDQDIRYRLIAQELMLARHVDLAKRVRNRVRAEFDRVMQQFDLLVAPAAPIPAYPAGATVIQCEDRLLDLRVPGTEHRLITRLTSPFNTLGTPVVCLPCGYHSTGKPIGLQLSGRRWQDDVVLRAAHAFEQAAGFGYRIPPVARARLSAS